MASATRLLCNQWQRSCEHLLQRLQGLTDDEYRWEPVDGSWNVRRDGDVSSRALAAQLMDTLVGWVQDQFVALGRRDARECAIELVVAYQGAAVVGSALGQPEVMARRANGLKKWIESLDAQTDRGRQHGGHGRKGVTL